MALHIGYGLAGFIIGFLIVGFGIPAMISGREEPPMPILIMWLIITILGGISGAFIGWGLA
jgi:hypothetical protein